MTIFPINPKFKTALKADYVITVESSDSYFDYLFNALIVFQRSFMFNTAY